ncbi:MAG: LamG domain-containing protein, partial [Candidatus Aenigmarchaeota archaeon]|nr:LamG domain-containing protein [Candidatus Aenigmarchaeota archaeon]
PSLNITDAITIEAWVKKASLTQHGPFIVEKEDESSYVYGLYHTYGGGEARSIRFHIRNSTGDVKGAGRFNITDLEWHHITGTFDGRYLKFYGEGVLLDTTDWGSMQTIKTGPGKLYIGVWGKNMGANHFNGTIDEVRIYNRALTPAEILQNFNAGN